MTENDVLRLLQKHMERQFPKTCHTCHRQFNTLEEYIRTTTNIGDPVSYDTDVADTSPPPTPVGTHTFANCPCGNTLSLSSTGISAARQWNLQRWLNEECARRSTTSKQLLAELRSKIDAQVLSGNSTH